ncbi:Spindle pole body component [Venustampulla echinocandica]|uniref:Spindle pole body component n=1 Tax=Venustampulla echinocandica TaxID=2656787 RepID=A0A370TLH3_9HELO|nr:Spindle pole body component [Venustampulla echinocandica]RDL36378.1 Spindle pole body component [Venustampulla echinocandica]
MAHIAKLGALTDELVALLTSASADGEPAKFNAHKESALRALRNHNYPRTNQFDVWNRLDGLDEKFRVYNEDQLADALKERLQKISRLEGKWSSEILHLLLELSDKPLANSKLKDLDLLKEPEPQTETPLRWKDLAANDPLLRDKHVWRNVDFGAESSDEDGLSDISMPTETTTQSSVEDDVDIHPNDHVVDVSSEEKLIELREAQFWLKTPSINGVKLETVKKPITELQAIREVLFMLAGFPTSLFEVRTEGSKIFEPCKGYALRHASPDSFRKLLKSLAADGSSITFLKSWAIRPQHIPLLQVFQAAILKHIAEFDGLLSRIQERFVDPADDVVVSLLLVKEEISSYIRSLICLSELTKRLDTEPYAHAFRYLEMLYEQASISQMGGDEEMYAFMGTLFFECFQVYLRPIRTWMEEGELEKEDKVFFVAESSGEMDTLSIWQARFKLRQTQDGTLHAPNFLQAAAGKIFTTGKSVVVLKHLNKVSLMESFERILEPSLDFATLCNPAALQLVPFVELFDGAFDAWIRSKHQYASSTLRKILFDQFGLCSSLDALSGIYFMADGAQGSAFTNPSYDKLDTLDVTWNDRFALTELARGAFGTLPSVSPDRLRIAVLPLSRKNQDIGRCRRTVKVLSIIELKYQLSWPIQIILTPDTISSYQRIFTFLIQIRRSSHILSRQRLATDLLTITSSSDERSLYYSLRTRLLWFIQALYYYISCLVLEPSSCKMREDLEAAVDIDSMVQVHSSYIKSTVNQALLGSKLELIHKTILKILDLAIKLEDAQAANAAGAKDTMDRQQEMMDLSMASLGLHTPQKPRRPSKFSPRNLKVANPKDEASSDDEEKDIDLSILSSTLLEGDETELSYFEKLLEMRADFDRLVRFVANGLRGVARAGGGQEARSWDTLGEMLEAGLGDGNGSIGRSY